MTDSHSTYKLSDHSSITSTLYHSNDSKKRTRDEDENYDSSSSSERKSKKSRKEKQLKHHKKEKNEKKEKKHKKHKKEKNSESLPFPIHNWNFSTKISRFDYDEKLEEFNYWLKDTRKISVGDLPSIGEARLIFRDEFIPLWNEKKLDDKYYSGEIRKESKEKKLSNKQSYVQPNLLKEKNSVIIGPQLPTKKKDEEDDEEDEDRKRIEELQKKKEKKKFIKYKEMVEEELVPKKTGHEALREKRKMKAQYTKPKKDDEVDAELDSHQIFGEGTDFQRILQKQKEKQLQKSLEKTEQMQEKLSAYQKKEQEKIAPFLSLLQSGRYKNPLQPYNEDKR